MSGTLEFRLNGKPIRVDSVSPNTTLLEWLRADPPLPAGSASVTRWLDAIAQALAPGPAQAQPDDLALLP